MVTWYEHALSQYIFDWSSFSLACRDERMFAGGAGVGMLEKGSEEWNRLSLTWTRVLGGEETMLVNLSVALVGIAWVGAKSGQRPKEARGLRRCSGWGESRVGTNPGQSRCHACGGSRVVVTS